VGQSLTMTATDCAIRQRLADLFYQDNGQ